MVPAGLKFDRRFGFALCLMAVAPLAAADDARARPVANAAPLEIPHSTNLALDRNAQKRDRKPGNIESSQIYTVTSGLSPLSWPKNSDIRARIMTPELRQTPVVGWVAENLYRSKNDNGWCLEVEPGHAYVVFYRLNLK